VGDRRRRRDGFARYLLLLATAISCAFLPAPTVGKMTGAGATLF